MIDAVRQWLASIILTSFLISLLRLMLPEGNLRKVGAFTGGLVLLTAVLRPLARLEPDWPDFDWTAYESAITERMEELNAEQEDAFRARVAEKTAEAIMTQSMRMGAAVSAKVTVRMTDGTPLPWAVTLDGAYSAGLSAWLESALDIPPERQFWNDD